MAKKKKSRKKSHRHTPKPGKIAASPRPQNQVQPVAAAASAAAPATPTTPSAASAPAVVAAKPFAAVPAVASGGRWSYVGTDIRRIGRLVIICIIIEAAAWVLVNHTGFGPSLYSHIGV